MAVDEKLEDKNAEIVDDKGAASGTKKPDGQTDPDTDEGGEEKVHPLEPGGKRFTEVYARAKKAEALAQQEKEARLVAEAELRVRKELGDTKTVTQEKVYSNAELDKFIEAGQMTRAEAADYRETQVVKKAVADAEKRIETKFRNENQFNTTTQGLRDYIEAVPDINQVGTETRNKVEVEYAWLCSVYGTPTKDSPEQRKMELIATRTVLGPLDKLNATKANERQTRQTREAVQESNSTTERNTDKRQGKDPIDSLTLAEKQHYEKMFQKTNAYPNEWEDVRKELLWKKPNLKARAR